MPTKWALLIGIDFYFRPEGTKSHKPRGLVTFNNLQGCVRDISRIEKYLNSLASNADQPSQIAIKKLTASVRIDSSTNEPQESESDRPTYHNIKREINAIQDAAQSGDLVYIHYSGHGILRKHLTKTNKHGDPISGTALALTDVMTGGAYLTGHRLGVWVRKLIKVKKVRVVVILDSCHSGRGLRDGDHTDTTVDDKLFNLRTSMSNVDMSLLESDERAEEEAQQDENLIMADSDHRNGTVTTTDWLSSPTGCTIITACQLNQQAGEYYFEGQDGYNGILTHWILDLVNNYAPLGPYSYEGLVRHVISRTRSTGRPQTAVLHGEGSFDFLGDRQLNQRSACLVELKEQPGKVEKFEVHVGASQGVAIGASYDVYNASSNFRQVADGTQHALIPLRIRIDRVFPLYSEATLAVTKALKHKGPPPQDIKKGDSLVAVLNSWSLPPQYQLGIEKLNIESPTCPFHVDIDHGNGVTRSFRIEKGTRSFRIETGQGEDWTPVPRLPFIRVDDPCANFRLTYMLRHVVRFHALKNFDYGRPNSDNTDGYEFELMGLQKNLNGDYDYETKHDQKVKVRFQNNTRNNDVHIAIFMFNGSYGVERLWPLQKDGQTTTQVPSKAQTYFSMRMEVPTQEHKSDRSDICDLIRAYVYVGSYPISWDEISQPDIPPHDSASLPTAVLAGVPKKASEVERESRHGRVLEDDDSTEAVHTSLREAQWAALDLNVHTTRHSV